MNKAEKIVFSRMLKKAEWNNTTLIGENIVEETRKLKQSAGNDMTILGSGNIVALFAENGLVDEYRFMLDPVAVGEGVPIFKGIKRQLDLERTGTRIFRNGIVLLNYRPIEKA